MTETPSYVTRNERSRERLRQVLARVGDALERPLDGGWTIASALVHLAFWDRFVLARWNHYDRAGAVLALPDEHVDLVNEAALPQWLAVPPRAAADLALAAAEAIDQRIAELAPAAVQTVLDSRPAMVDRSRHRHLHLDEIERVLEIGAA